LVHGGFVDTSNIIVDSKSGVTGGGRSASIQLLFGEVNESLKAYKVNAHQHMPEIYQELENIVRRGNKEVSGKLNVTFVPHLIPMNRGMLSTIYFSTNINMSYAQVIDVYRDFYKGEPFVRVLKEGIFPQTRDVCGTNYCDIGIEVQENSKRIIVITAIDNLGKGASGQAVQNMNIMYGFAETAGLF
jgi:N-acetyl-gamma-glutamyl-phosphate reductase